jgi:hypothetical protein
MSEINIVRTIKPKKGMHIAEGRSEYIGKHPYGEGREGHFVLFKVVWRAGFFRSQNSLLALPDLCLGVSRLPTTSAVGSALGRVFRWPAKRSAPCFLTASPRACSSISAKPALVFSSSRLSEIKIAVVIEEKDVERAAPDIHAEFGLARNWTES